MEAENENEEWRGLTVEEAQRLVRQYLDERGWTPTDTEGRYYTMIHAMEEMGELARCITHLESRRAEVHAKTGGRATTLRELEYELGDLFYHLLKIADMYKLNLAHAFTITLEKDYAKYPLEMFKDSGF
jgi:NTP pyrophosphatase (non-canonical NTP hydrolase)